MKSKIKVIVVIMAALVIVPTTLPSALTFGNTSNINKNITNERRSQAQSSDYEDIITKEPIVNVREFGAKGDGISDDTDAIQAALNKQGNVYIPDGTYMVNALKHLNPLSNTRIIMAKNAVIQAIPNNLDTYAIFNLSNVENIIIVGGTVKGERSQHTGTTGEWGHCIKIIEGCKNIKIDSVTTQDGWGDGIYLGSNMTLNYPKNVLIINVLSTNNRRQGLSIVSCDGVVIQDSDFTNQNGTSPESGIGIEPNHWDTDKGIAPKDIIIENCLLSGNNGKGFYAAFETHNITIKNSKALNNKRYGFATFYDERSGHTDMKLENCIADGNTNKGFYFTKTNGLNIINCRTLNNSSEQIYVDKSSSNILIR